jgi:catechol 2,3-dioxygenase-like lactoylglutathione lyase family enzyme
MPKPVLTHIALHVADLDKSVAFYTGFAKMSLVHRREDKETNQTTAWVTSQDTAGTVDFVIVLLCGDPSLFGGARPQAPLGPVSHFGFAMQSREEVDDIARQAEEAGLLLRPAEYVNEVVAYICFVRDPDGHSVEFSYGQDIDRHEVH